METSFGGDGAYLDSFFVQGDVLLCFVCDFPVRFRFHLTDETSIRRIQVELYGDGLGNSQNKNEFSKRLQFSLVCETLDINLEIFRPMAIS